MDNLVEVRGLAKTFRREDGTPLHAVKGINLDIRRGEIFSLLGPNGAGKTTTISMISGLLEPSAGDATIGGYSITKQPLEAKRLLGVVPQEVAVYPELSARRNLDFFGRMYGLRGAELRKRIDETLEFINLKDRQNEKVKTFSGGMKRRVNIGIGLLHRPQLVYMDEPTVGVDPQSRRRILDTILRLRDEQGMAVLYTTHLIEEAQELSNRVGIIDHGEIIALGTVGELVLQVGEQDQLVFSVNAPTVDEALLRRLESDVEGVTGATFNADEEDAGGSIVVYATRGRRALAPLIQIISGEGLEINAVQVKEPDLEAVFLHLTGRALRE
jgi:ABC-2 type transport system ATP-binding protein